jgi:hypothetical protein
MASRWRRKSLGSIGLAASLIATSTGYSSDSIYYHSQKDADVALLAFDRNNADCQLWTNWQKMCSRTGAGGSTVCVSDSVIPVRPSAPFCAEVSIKARAEFRRSKLFEPDTSVESKSRERYCILKGSILKCQSARPFSGSHLAARRHGLCEIWSENKAPAFRPICSEFTSDDGLKTCEALSRKKFKSSSMLYCSKRSPDIQYTNCISIGGWGDGPDFGESDHYETIAIGRKGELPVVGIYCE